MSEEDNIIFQTIVGNGSLIRFTDVRVLREFYITNWDLVKEYSIYIDYNYYTSNIKYYLILFRDFEFKLSKIRPGMCCGYDFTTECFMVDINLSEVVEFKDFNLKMETGKICLTTSSEFIKSPDFIYNRKNDKMHKILPEEQIKIINNDLLTDAQVTEKYTPLIKIAPSAIEFIRQTEDLQKLAVETNHTLIKLFNNTSF